LEDTSRSELPPAAGTPQAELGHYLTPALADSNPLVELGQPTVEPRCSKLPYGWESWNTGGLVKADSSNLAELAHKRQFRTYTVPNRKGISHSLMSLISTTLLLNRIQLHKIVTCPHRSERRKMKNWLS
jgi:hypothetical protein